MTIQVVLAWATEKLSSRLEAELLLAHVLSVSRLYLLTWPEQPLTLETIKQVKKLVLHRKRGKPIAYLIGVKEFWSLPLKVNSSVLIPRPETEILVERLLTQFNDPESQIRVLELGTGSGAIALALAKERPHWEIIATDVSEAALRIAKRNAKSLQILSVKWMLGDWFKAISSLEPNKKLFDVIVSNPPYVAKSDAHLAKGDLRFEPKHALISGKTGLKAIEHIISKSGKYLLYGGWLMLEHGETQAKALKLLFKEFKFINLKTYKDLAGANRLTVGCYKNPENKA